MKKYICKYCGKEFDVPTQLGGHVTKEHSLEVKKRGRDRSSELQEEYYYNPKKCKECNKDIPFEKRRNIFCSSSCSASFSNKNRSKKKINKKNCLNCGKVFVPSRNTKEKFCSRECGHNYKKEITIKNFLDDSIILTEQQVRKNTIKNFLLKEQNELCNICGVKNTWNGKELVFVLDHIDGNSENNNKDNLRLICPNCDSQLDTYKSKNKGNGRYFRRERYKQGKSY